MAFLRFHTYSIILKFNRNLDEMHEIRQKSSIGNPEITVEIEEITLEISFLEEIV